ncbi:MAG: F0F1 ATP synthase subunit B [Bacteroidales bacterium]|jgi:F-type H+-transporting ATPase subunit b|nr:F0F1 ATP synthase subunit B [Bacteroidales bacterium]MDD2280413.1 F0F1 ATP synthase subunit B [Bacteroidales bacterium]MDD4292424.1 F0F1 ATP synthase subunit B [Bacteroidales bacterium]MDD4491507.1 F0F1 ATP synthase subunit B [Bacteroidales bacterium]
MSLLVPESGLLFWMCLSFGIVFFIVARYGFPVILKSVEARRVFIQKSLDDANTAKAMLENIKSQSDSMIASAREEQMNIIREANKLKNSIIKSANDEARELTKKQIESVRIEIQNEKEGAMRDIRSQIALLSVDIAEKLVRTELKESPAQMQLINKLLNESSPFKS